MGWTSTCRWGRGTAEDADWSEPGDFQITAALQRGCLALAVPPDSRVQSVADLRNKTIPGAKVVFGAPMAEPGLNPDVSVVWTPPPSIANEVPTLQSGEFAAVQHCTRAAASHVIDRR